jgi:hypothetical protein
MQVRVARHTWRTDGRARVGLAWRLCRQDATVGARHLEAKLSLQQSNDWLSQAASNVLQATSIASSAAVANGVTQSDGKRMDVQGGQANWP